MAFPHIAKQTFISDLEDRIRNPALIRQGDASLCGPASFMYCLAHLSPLTYASFAIDLYEKGEAVLGDVNVKPSKDCKNHTPTIAGVDWVTLAGLRDSENAMFDYQHEKNEFSGITLPSAVSKWFKKLGFEVERDTNLLGDKDLACLFKGLHHYRSGKMVCLFVGGKVMTSRSWGKVFPDHWVVLASDIRINGLPAIVSNTSKTIMKGTIDFEVYSWGSEKSINRFRYYDEKSKQVITNPNNPMTVEQFLDYFYGIVAVSYPQRKCIPLSDFNNAA